MQIIDSENRSGHDGMKTPVTMLSDKAKDATRWTVKQMLEDASQSVDNGKYKNNKAIILFVNDDGNAYDVGFHQAGMTMSECIALVDITKSILKREMGY